MNEDTTILIVDDDFDILQAAKMMLESKGYQVVAAGSGFQALEVLAQQPVNLIIADIAMPNMNGYQLFKEVSQHRDWNSIPFIFLSARGLDSDIRYGKELGVDDYLVKPVQSQDLLATVRGKLRRFQDRAQTVTPAPIAADVPSPMPTSLSSGVLILADLKIDLPGHSVWLGDRSIQLSVREFKLLAFLAQNVGRVIAHENIVEVTHDLETDRQEASSLLRSMVRSLRRKLGYEPGESGCIESVRGIGYQFVPPSLPDDQPGTE
jgi:DNA-binding response OmpR family regulator